MAYKLASQNEVFKLQILIFKLQENLWSLRIVVAIDNQFGESGITAKQREKKKIFLNAFCIIVTWMKILTKWIFVIDYQINNDIIFGIHLFSHLYPSNLILNENLENTI